ncbi:MAG: YncE family protein [Myxococcota bacterium]
MGRLGLVWAAVLILATAWDFTVASATAQPGFVAFESGPVRPLALSPSGDLLFATNTPDGHLEIFDVGAGGELAHRGSVAVGMEPVAVAARTDEEVWVVNHLSDSVSIVDVPSRRVVRTLLVGDEPRDIVFAGPDGSRAFVTTAHRGQHRTHPSLAGVPGAGDPELTTPGVGRADVWVFDADDLGDAVGGVPAAIVVLFGDTPRPLAASPDGSTVYAGVFHSGNRTAVVPEGAVCDGFDAADPCEVDGTTMPGGLPGPSANADGDPAPETGLVVQYDPMADAWLDDEGRDWSGAIRFDLPDYDVFALDAATLEEQPGSPVAHVGTTIFNLAVNPVTGVLYASNTEARNRTRFEGPGVHGGSTVQGRLHEARITVIEDGEATPRHLNGHIDYDVRPAPPGTAQHSLATPLEMAVSEDGSTIYVAAFGSSRVGVIPTGALEDGSFDPTAASADHIEVSGGGPAGLALDETRGRLYVLTRFDNAVATIDLVAGAEIDKVPMHNPEPDPVAEGRPLLYDARQTSSNGEASCASCHIFGDTDHLSWDLGNPDAPVTQSPMEIRLETFSFSDINGTGNPEDFHPMKGPMATQTLRGLENHGAQHWRGDRATGFYGTAPYDADLAFRNFNAAFVDLVGREEPIDDDAMQAFADFALALTMPPNPVRNLDNSLTASQARGRDFFAGPRRADGNPFGDGFSCEGCHRLDPEQGFFGTDGRQSFENEPQIIKIAQLRNLYQKVGMFGMIDTPFLNAGNNGHKGPQVRGTGFIHDGSVDTLFRFFQATVFNATGGDQGFQGGDPERRDMEAFMLAFPSDLAPIVGQQVTLTGDNADVAGLRIDLLLERAATPFVSKSLGGEVTECDLIAKVSADGRIRGYVYRSDGTFEPDDESGRLTDAELRALAEPGREVTYTCVPPGSGERAGVDRDGDGLFDGVDNCPSVHNPDQGDMDGDGIGDVCQDTGMGTDAGMGSDAGAGGDAGRAGPDAGSPPDSGDGDGGCGCEVAGASSTGFGRGWALLGVAALALLRRRKRAAR